MAAKGARKAAQVSGAEHRPPPGKPFKKGQSGNPGGQPKWVKEVRDLLMEDAAAARKLLRRVIDDEGEETKERVRASEIVLSYTIPKPKQEMEVSGSVSTLQGIDAETIRKIASLKTD